ncbi:unnamed protein product [Cochlearia groenlandica]
MDKFSYNSYPDSAESSPRSRETEFDNPPPWEDQQHSYKVKFMCSYGGKIQPRPHDNQLTYVNGDTKIMSVDRGIRFPVFASKLSSVIGGFGGGGGGGDVGGEISFKYQLPGEDLDALISVTNDEDLEHMMHEYDRLLRISTKPARMRLFLFSSSSSSISGGFGSESAKSGLNQNPSRPESEKSVTAPPSNNADFLFGSEKLAPNPPPPSAVIQDPTAIEPAAMFVNHQQAIQQDQGLSPAEIQRQIHEFQRIQIRDQEQQQQLQHQIQQQQQQQQEAAMYRRNSEEGGGYFTPASTTISPTNPQQPPIGYWQENNNVYTTTSQNQQEQQVYMISSQAQAQAQGTLYQSVMRPMAQANQGYYQPPVQRIPHDAYIEQQNQTGYNVAQQQQPQYSGGPMGGNHVQYYTMAREGMMVQPQYQGMGQQPVSGVTGPDGQVMVNSVPKVTQSSDSV